MERRFSLFSSKKRAKEAEAEAARLQQQLQDERAQQFQERQRNEQLERTQQLARERQEQQQREMEQMRRQLARQEIDKQQRAQREQERKRAEAAQRDRERRRHEEKLERMRQMSPETLRSLRELIRQKYALDVEIWDLRGARKPDRPFVYEKMEKADATLQEIIGMIGAWEGTQSSWTKREWELIEEIRERMGRRVTREWGDKPPWDED